MKLFLFQSTLIAAILVLYKTLLIQVFRSLTSTTAASTVNPESTSTSDCSDNHMSATATLKNTMVKLSHAKIVPRRSDARGHADHGWLNTYHTFSFANYHDSKYTDFGSLRVLNEDRVAGGTGFPTHPHRDAEIFSYILNGELTHRDSMIQKGAERKEGDDFYRMKRGDVQFTTGGTGIAHSEQNESNEQVHFLQIWALPWARGLTPRYHTKSYPEELKRKAFQPILSPLAAGPGASAAEEMAAIPILPDTIPIHADFVMGAGLIGVDKRFKWAIGGAGLKGEEDVVKSKENRRVYVHLPMTQKGNARIRLDGREDAVLNEGDGAFISGVAAGDILSVESVGEAEAEVIVLDSA